MSLRAPALLAALLCAAPAVGFDSFDPDVTSPPPLADGNASGLPSIAAHRIPDGSFVMDGRLDEAFWSDAELGGGFRQTEPDRGNDPSVPTTFRVVYDSDAVIFGVACWEDDPSLISSVMGRRDNVHNSDIVSIYIDPYLDRTTGYNFRVSPDAVLADAYLFDDGNRDWDWDAVWDAAVHRDEHGWYVEARIPFSALRYQPGDDRVWGLQVYRWMHGRGEDTGWVSWDRELSGFVSRFGTLTGMNGLEAPRNLEITPYVAGRVTDPAAAGRDGYEGWRNGGVDLKYGVTANMTLNATVQPDFGQVEADPAVLNLSPFETFFSEKRPFFVEGSRFFDMNGFDLLYSRRIGTGRENSRIRYAGKLIGKTAGDVSVAALVAATDIADEGEAWNPLSDGRNRSRYGAVRLGRESADGAHRVNVMQTVVMRDDEPWRDDDSLRDHRDAMATGLDFDLNFRDRTWNVNGSVVRTHTAPHDNLEDPALMPEDRIGTGGTLGLGKVGGDWTGGLRGSWESDRLDPNDLGRLSAPDEMNARAWLTRRFDSDGEDRWFRNGNVHASVIRSWLYAGSTVLDADGDVLWSYGSRHDQDVGGNIGFFVQTSSYWNMWGGAWRHGHGYNKYSTRSYDGRRGPLIERFDRHGFWAGVQSDWRRDVNGRIEVNVSSTDMGDTGLHLNAGLHWVMGARMTNDLNLGFSDNTSDAQWLFNDASPTGGIGGVDYVFAQLDQRTWSFTWRSSVLFDRNRSLELYLQPFLTVGDYSRARALAAPATYDFVDFAPEGFDVRDHDFSYAAVNLNLIYRWEYRPGSTFYLVWSHGRDTYRQRSMHGRGTDDWRLFDNGFGTDSFLADEPENVLLTKVTYWFSV